MRILLVGSEYGLGKFVYKELDVSCHEIVQSHFNIMNEKDVVGFMAYQQAFDCLIYCAGVNRINRFDESPEEDFWESMDVNCYGFVRLIKIIREKNKWNPGMKVCFVTSNAANVPMRHSLAYNCSKAAANMAIKQMAREISPTEMVIFGVAPNKLEGTPMSREIEKKVLEMRGWTAEEAKRYQLEALPARIETDPECLAIFISMILTGPYFPYIHGNILPFGGPV